MDTTPLCPSGITDPNGAELKPKTGEDGDEDAKSVLSGISDVSTSQQSRPSRSRDRGRDGFAVESQKVSEYRSKVRQEL